jgi:hypothetical protein
LGEQQVAAIGAWRFDDNPPLVLSWNWGIIEELKVKLTYEKCERFMMLWESAEDSAGAALSSKLRRENKRFTVPQCRIPWINQRLTLP